MRSNAHTHDSCPAPPRRGLNRAQAAAYIGVSPTKFDDLLRDAKMPGPKRVGGRRIWDRHAIDAAFDALDPPGDDGVKNEWD